VKTIWQGRMTQTVAKYGEHAPMAATCWRVAARLADLDVAIPTQEAAVRRAEDEHAHARAVLR
jgi:hypothetical protein